MSTRNVSPYSKSMLDEYDPNAEIRYAQQVLLMVHELHKRGYQRLRTDPGMSPSGCFWRCVIIPTPSTLVSQGNMTGNYGGCVHYTSGMGNRYFNWTDARQDTARQLADKFVERFPEVVRAGLGSDWNYAGWYVEMLGFAERGYLPVAYADWDWEPNYLAKDDEGRELPFPPGEA